MSLPYLTHTRLVPIRRLTEAESEILEFRGPLTVARRERRFILGPWRKDRDVVVVRGSVADESDIVMACSLGQLRERGIRI